MRGFARMLAAQAALLLFLVGLALLAAGLWDLSPPLAMIAVGAIFMAIGIGAELYGDRRGGTQ